MRLQFQLAFFVGHGTRDNVRVHDPRALVHVVVGVGLRHFFFGLKHVYNYNQCRYVIYGDKSHIDIGIDIVIDIVNGAIGKKLIA
jgi:hypothetical protein